MHIRLGVARERDEVLAEARQGECAPVGQGWAEEAAQQAHVPLTSLVRAQGWILCVVAMDDAGVLCAVCCGVSLPHTTTCACAATVEEPTQPHPEPSTTSPTSSVDLLYTSLRQCTCPSRALLNVVC